MHLSAIWRGFGEEMERLSQRECLRVVLSLAVLTNFRLTDLTRSLGTERGIHVDLSVW